MFIRVPALSLDGYDDFKDGGATHAGKSTGCITRQIIDEQKGGKNKTRGEKIWLKYVE